MGMPDDFCAFILTHGRPNNVKTLRTLDQQGYTGKVYLVVDDQDSTLPEYIERYGDKVLVFQKEEVAAYTDEGDNFRNRKVILYARNVCFDLAEKVGCRRFIQLDDDYTGFRFKFNGKRQYGSWKIKDLDRVLSEMLEYFEATPILTLAMSQGGDHIGGYVANDKKSINTKRKAMNSFICSTDRPFKFFGSINEDVNAYSSMSRRGDIFLTLMGLELMQTPSQTSASGMSDIYREGGTYVKSFYSVMYAPSCVVVKNIVAGFKRIHHKVDWSLAAPKIVREDHRKRSNGTSRKQPQGREAT